MGVLAVDEVMLREPRLLVPNLRPVGRVRVAENIPTMPKNWYPNNIAAEIGLRDIVTGLLIAASSSNCVFEVRGPWGAGFRQNTMSSPPSVLTSNTVLYGIMVELLWHQTSSFTSAVGSGALLVNAGQVYGLVLGLQTSYLTNELISFYSKTAERVSGYCSTADTVYTNGSTINRFLFWWDADSSEMRFSWNGKEYPVTKSTTAITLNDLTLAPSDLLLSGGGSVEDRTFGHIVIWDKPITPAFANDMTYNPNQFLIPA